MHVRPSVMAFAEAMEAKLRAHASKGDRPAWHGMSGSVLLGRLHEEVAELHTAVYIPQHPMTAAEKQCVLDEAADVANFAMMVADACGGLPLDPAAP